MTTHETGIGLTAHAETLGATLARTFATYLQAEAITSGSLHLLFVIRADGAPLAAAIIDGLADGTGRLTPATWQAHPDGSATFRYLATPAARPVVNIWKDDMDDLTGHILAALQDSRHQRTPQHPSVPEQPALF